MNHSQMEIGGEFREKSMSTYKIDPTLLYAIPFPIQNPFSSGSHSYRWEGIALLGYAEAGKNQWTPGFSKVH